MPTALMAMKHLFWVFYSLSYLEDAHDDGNELSFFLKVDVSLVVVTFVLKYYLCGYELMLFMVGCC